MRRISIITGIMLPILLTGLTVSGTMAATAKKKPAPPKKPAGTQNHATTGTSQLKGEYANFGETYTLGKSAPWNVTLKSAEYTTNRIKIGDRRYIAKAGEKLLVLHFNVHNPQKNEALMRFDTFALTAVDSKDNNWESIEEIGNEATKEKVDMEMKPAQKMDIFTAIAVPANGEIPKIIVKSPDELVLRYDLRGKVKGMIAPFADASDKVGATAVDNVAAVPDTYYPLAAFDVKFEGAQYSTEKLDDSELEEGSRYLVLKFTAKNDQAEQTLLRFDSFEAKLADADGNEVEWNGEMLQGTRNKRLDQMMDPGKEIKFRFYFAVPNDLKPATFTIKEGESRVYVFDMSGVN